MLDFYHAATRNRAWVAAMLLALAGFALPLMAQGPSQGDYPYLDQEGRVIRVSAIGGESTGYALKIRGGVSISGTVYKQIELDPNGVDLRPYLFTKVLVSGPVEARTGLERGTYLVLVVESIRRIR